MSNKSLLKRIARDPRSFLQRDVEPLAPPRLSDPVRFPYGAFQLRITAPRDMGYEIQASSDFKNWTTIDRAASTGEPIDYVDSSAAKFSHRFYRTVSDEIRSSNLMGYATVTLGPGFSMIANPFNAPSNRVADLFKGLPEGITVNKFDTRAFRLNENHFKNGRWSDSGETLMPGEGAILFNPTSDYRPLNFVGEVMEDELSLPVPAGFSIRSSLVPLAGRVHEDLGFPISEGDVIHLFDTNRQQYVLYPYQDLEKWSANPPMINAGESFWVEKASPKTWIRQSLRRI